MMDIFITAVCISSTPYPADKYFLR